MFRPTPAVRIGINAISFLLKLRHAIEYQDYMESILYKEIEM